MASIDYADKGLSIAFEGALLANVLREPLTLERARALYRAAQKAADLYKGKAVSLTIVEPTAAASQPPEVRELTTKLSKDFTLLGSAIVIEGSGFAAATARTMIAGIYLLSKRSYPNKICATVADGASFLSPILSRNAAEISKFAEQTRAALRA